MLSTTLNEASPKVISATRQEVDKARRRWNYEDVRCDRVKGMLLADIAAKYGMALMTAWKITQTIQHKNRWNRSLVTHCRGGKVEKFI
jgi:hypothetical protein